MNRTFDYILLEISVDRTNEKGVFVASQILIALHAIVKKKQSQTSWFRFEIAHIHGQIRFFLWTQKKYKNLLEGQLYAHYPNIEIQACSDFLAKDTSIQTIQADIKDFSLKNIKLYTVLKDRTEKESVDPLSSITSALAKTPKNDISFFHVDFSPLHDTHWRTAEKIAILQSTYPDWYKRFLFSFGSTIKMLLLPFSIFSKFLGFIFQWEKNDTPETDPTNNEHNTEQKHNNYGYNVQIFLGKEVKNTESDAIFLRELTSTLNIFSEPNGNSFTVKSPIFQQASSFRNAIPQKKLNILNVAELAGLVHLPTLYVKTPGVNWVSTRKFEPPHNLPNTEHPNTPIGISNYRESQQTFGIQPIDRARHIYIIGKTGMGKSTLLENMIYSDILTGRGVGLIDPHGDLSETILENIPKSRTNDIILFDPSDTEYPITFNMLDTPKPELYSIVGSGIVSIFKKMFADSWGPRLEYILRNTILTLLLVGDATLISIPLILTHASYRKKIIGKLTDPILIQFWTQEFEKMPPNMINEAINPILNKVGQFLSSPILRNILGQQRNPFSLRWIMDNQKIFIVNLSKGLIGEDASMLLGAMMVTKFQIEAMSRADIPERDRKDFGLYVDEFQNFATDSFATILSEARKYKLSLIMANQYIAQMPDTVVDAVFGNVGSLISFQVGHQDSLELVNTFGGEDIILPQDLTNLKKYDIYTKLLIDGMPSSVFSATTFSPLYTRIDTPVQQSRDVILRVTREKYAKKKSVVEKKIFDMTTQIRENEIAFQKQQRAQKEKMQHEKREQAKQARKEKAE